MRWLKLLDGKYKATVNTPLGNINGTITLVSNGNNVQGILETMGMKNDFYGAKISNNTCKFIGDLSTPIGKFNYTATCTVNGNNLEVSAISGKNTFKINGTRI